MTITLLELRTKARQRADLENSDYVTDSELTGLINDSIAELQDLLISTYQGDYYLESVSFNTTAGQDTYPLPNGTLYSAAKAFYKLKGVDAQQIAGQYFAVSPFNFNERNRNSDVAWSLLSGPNIRYRLSGNNLKFSPVPDVSTPVRIWYIPAAVKLVADGDTLDDVNAYSEYVVVDAAIKCRIKEELEIQTLELLKSQLQKRIVEMAQNRDAGSPESISDIYAANDEYYFMRGQ